MGRLRTLLERYNERVQAVVEAYVNRTKTFMDTHNEWVKTMLDMNNEPIVLNNGRLCEAISVVIQELHTIKEKRANCSLGGLKDE